MYDLATLSHRYRYAGISTQNPRDYEEWNNNAIENFQKDPFTASNYAKDEDDNSPCPYSKDLMGLIEECLKPAMAVRIKAQEVKAITEKILARYGSDDGQQINEKVYFRGNEINGMPLGHEDFPFYDGRDALIPARQNDWSDMDQLMSYPDPDEPELKLPRWLKRISQYKEDRRKEREQQYNKYWQEHCRIEGGKVIFQDRRADPNAVQSGSDSNNATTADVPEIPDSQDDPQIQPDVAVDIAAAAVAAIVAPAVAAAMDPVTAPATAPFTAPYQATVEDDVPSDEGSAQTSRAQSPPRKAPAKKPAAATATATAAATASGRGSGSGARQSDNKKGANSQAKPKAATGTGVKNTTAEKAAAAAATATKAPAKKGAVKKPAAKAAATAAASSAPQPQVAAPRRERLPRNAKNDIPAGKYKT